MAGQARRAEETWPSAGWHVSPWKKMPLCHTVLPQAGRMRRQSHIPEREPDRSGTRAQSACSSAKTWPAASGRAGKGHAAGADACRIPQAGCKSWPGRTCGALKQPAQKQWEGRTGGDGVAERTRKDRPQSGRGDAHKKSPCSFLQGRNMVGHQGLEPRTN